MRFTLEETGKDIKKQVFNHSIESIREELDEFYSIMSSFSVDDSIDIFKDLAGFTARASYLRSQIMRRPENRGLTNFRTKELDPFIDECDRQFKLWSRAFAVQSYEWEMTKG